MTPKRARAIGEEFAESEGQMQAINASLARDDARRTLAVKLAANSYGSDDVEISSEIDSVDGGYWVSARVWVDAQDVEHAMGDEQRG